MEAIGNTRLSLLSLRGYKSSKRCCRFSLKYGDEFRNNFSNFREVTPTRVTHRKRFVIAACVEPGNDGDKEEKVSNSTEPVALEVEVAPHLRGIVSGSETVAPPSNGESLIERNLRKRRLLNKGSDAGGNYETKDPREGEKSTSDRSTEGNFSTYEPKILSETSKLSNYLRIWKNYLPPFANFFCGPNGDPIREGSALEALIAIKVFSSFRASQGDLRLTDKTVNNLFENADVLLLFYAFLGNGFVGFGDLAGKPEETRIKLQKDLNEKLPGFVCLLTEVNPLAMFHKHIYPSNEYALPERTTAVIVAPTLELLTPTFPEPLSSLAPILLSLLTVFAVQIPQQSPYYEQVPPVLAASCQASVLIVAAATHLGRFAAASFHGEGNKLSFPIFLPFPFAGCLGTLTFTKGCVSNRETMMDIAFGSILGSLLASAALFAIGSFSTHSSELSEYVYVSENSFFLFEWVKNTALGNAAFVLPQGTGSGSLLAMDPFILTGLLGLQMTLFNLLPIGITDGGRLLRGLGLTLTKIDLPMKPIDQLEFLSAFKQTLFLDTVFGASAVFVTVRAIECGQLSVLLLSGLYLIPIFVRRDLFQFDEVSDPGVVRSAVGLWLTSIVSALAAASLFTSAANFTHLLI